MARQDRYRLNNSPGREDNLSGTDVSAGNPEPVQYNIGTLNDFYQRTLTQDFLRNKFLLGGENGLFEGFVTNNVTTNITGSTIPLTDPLFRADLTGEVTIQLGSSIFSFLNQAGVEAGARLTIINHIANRRFSSDIERIDGANGRIILEDSVPADRRLLFDENSDGANTITVIRNDGISIEGPLNVNGIITGNFGTVQSVDKSVIDAAIGVSSDGDENRVYNQRGNFVEVDPGSNLVDDFVPTSKSGVNVETFITSDFNTFTTQSDYVNSTAASFSLNNSITMTDSTTVVFGSLLSSVFSNVNVVVGNRITISNVANNNLRFIRTIASIDASAGTITLSAGITEWAMLNNSSFNSSNNTVIFSTNTRTTVEGELRVTGRIDGAVDRARALTNINTASGAIQATDDWRGTEVEYQRLLSLGLIDDNTNYDTY